MGDFVIHPADNVQIDLASGHKFARREIRRGEKVIKYGFPIGSALCDIHPGEKVHTHNLITDLSARQNYRYTSFKDDFPQEEPLFCSAFLRENGEVGLRNDVWIIPTVGCVNGVAEAIARETGAFCFPHPYGCSQLGEDLKTTQKILCGLIRHPNAGGVLVLGLGCENNSIAALKEELGVFNEKRVRFLEAQSCRDEIAEGTSLVRALQAQADADRRGKVPVSRLVIGLKCGGSDGLSGITANPMVGRITDRFVSMGASAVLTEVPEMFGAEQILLDRCVSRDVFEKAVRMLNGFKDYFLSHHQSVSENPSPGNRAGGITTLEEKSLGCVQKGGTAPVVDVLDTGDRALKKGLNLLNGPGNDPVALTNLTAAGCHLILFTTGRGTPLGAPVPTLKIATRSVLAEQKKNWIDFDAQKGSDRELLQLILETANGAKTQNEKNACREIAVFKDGVTL